MRKRLRSLVKFVEKTARRHIYTDFLDMMGDERQIDLPGFDSGPDIERFRDKTQRFLKVYEDDPAIHKLRWNEPLTREDLDRLERIMVQAAAESIGQLKKVRSKDLPVSTTILIPMWASFSNPSAEGCPPRQSVGVTWPKFGMPFAFRRCPVVCWAAKDFEGGVCLVCLRGCACSDRRQDHKQHNSDH